VVKYYVQSVRERRDFGVLLLMIDVLAIIRGYLHTTGTFSPLLFAEDLDHCPKTSFAPEALFHLQLLRPPYGYAVASQRMKVMQCSAIQPKGPRVCRRVHLLEPEVH